MRKTKYLLQSAGAAILAASLPVMASAQDQQPGAGAAQNADDEGDDTIIVTGSLIRGGTFNAPTPVTSLTQETLIATAPDNLAEGLKQLPSITPGGGQTAGGGTRSGGQNFLNMRDLGADRTLTLLDGRRFVPADARLLTDVNLIPQSLVERVDVVTGGASATYGSDAVAGVVNFVLNRNFEGFEFEAIYGVSQKGDNQDVKFTATGGFDLGERVHVIASGEYYWGEGLDGFSREFRRHAPNVFLNPAGDPTYVTGEDIRMPYTDGGLIAEGPLCGNQFFGDGVVTAFDYGTLSSDTCSRRGTHSGGDGWAPSTGQEIVRPLERRSLFAHADIELADNVTMMLEGTYGWSMSNFQSSPNRATFYIYQDNPYLQEEAPSIYQQMVDGNISRIRINRLLLERGPSVTDNENEAIGAMAGFEGALGNFDWGATYSYGRLVNDAPMYPNLIRGNLDRAVRAVRDSNDQIVCLDTLSTNPDVAAAAAGCQPLNPFGQGAPSEQSLDYVMGTSMSRTVVDQHVADMHFSGPLLALPAGDLLMAAGASWREATVETTSDPLSEAGAFRLVNTQAFFGQYNVKEVFGELNVPVIKDSPLAQELSLSLAGRYTDYSTSGGVETWKIGVNWQVVDDLRLRGTISRDIRAPNLEELFATGRQNSITITDTFNGTTEVYSAVPNLTFGNVNLRPERAITKVVGFVYQPGFVPDFSLAVDYYDIKITDAITNIGGQTAVEECNKAGRTGDVCDLVIRDTTGAVIGTRTSPVNFASQIARGFDFETQYRTSFASGASLSFRFLANYQVKNVNISPLLVAPIDNAGDGTPRFRANASVNYSNGPLGVSLNGRLIGSYDWDRDRDADFDRIPAQFYLDGQISYELEMFGGEQEVFLNVRNLLDKGLVFDPSPDGGTPLPTNPNLFDQVGRMFRIGVRTRF